MKRLLKLNQFHDYQFRAANFQLLHPLNFLWLFMGAGKTPVTLTTIAHLLTHGAIRAALVLAPLRVAQSVWERESLKWEHLTGLRFSLIHGTPQERLRALMKPADVYLINYEGLSWLSTQLQHYYIRNGWLLPFDMLVCDEVSKLKNFDTKRMEAIIPLLPYFIYKTGLTGTPASNGLVNLFGQFLVIDGGIRLGRNYGAFLSNYFTTADSRYKHVPTVEGKKAIYHRISDIVLEMNEKDYLDLPDMIINDIWVDLSPKHRRQYDRLEMELFTELDNGAQVEVNNECGKTNKCLQYSGGFVYTNTETKEWHPAHDAKLDALEDILEEENGNPVLLGYNFRPDAARIIKRFPFARNITGMGKREFDQVLVDWDRGEIPLLIGHPASMGHGIDGLQNRGNVLVQFGLPWSLEQDLQFKSRIQRQGQGRPVTCHRILTRNTFDLVVDMSLQDKAETQDDVRAAVNRYRQMKEGKLAA